ncbi:hypothetical protein ALC62_09072, partial [Cyphomyrmex costatus]
IFTLKGRVCKLQNHIDSLLCKLNNACDAVRNLQQELRDRDKQLQQYTLDKQKLIQRYNIIMQAETDRVTDEMQMKLQEQREQLMSCIKKKNDKLKLVRQILTSTREDTCDNVTLTPPIASSSRIETKEKSTLIISKKKPSLMMPIDLQASKTSREHICQTLSSRARTISNNDTHEKIIEGPCLSSSKEKNSSMTFTNSPISSSCDQIRQKSCHTRTDSDNVQGKITNETILMTIAESSMPSDLKTEIVEKPNSKILVDSPSSSIITSPDTTIITKVNCNKKDEILVANSQYQQVQNADRWIDHRPARIVPTGTILQPRTQSHKRIIPKLSNPKDVMVKSSRYCHLSQERDADDELETKLYKAYELPICEGPQIVSNDIECLKHIKRNG